MNNPSHPFQSGHTTSRRSPVTPTYITGYLGTSSVFVWHHPDDGWFRDMFSKHLSMAKRTGRMVTLGEANVAVGADKVEALRTVMREADIIVLLVSADLL